MSVGKNFRPFLFTHPNPNALAFGTGLESYLALCYSTFHLLEVLAVSRMADIPIPELPGSLQPPPVRLLPNPLNYLGERSPVQIPDDILSIELLYRYNVLYSRARLLKHWRRRDTFHLTDDAVADMIRKDLGHYCEISTTLLSKHQSKKKGSQSRARLSCFSRHK